MAVFVYSSYRDAIDGFVGQYRTKEDAESAIYEIWVKEMLSWPQNITEQDKEIFKGDALVASQTPKPSIQTWNSKMYDGYSLRYMDSLGNYAYIIFDPNFRADSV